MIQKNSKKKKTNTFLGQIQCLIQPKMIQPEMNFFLSKGHKEFLSLSQIVQ